MANEQLLRRQRIGILQQSKSAEGGHWGASATASSNFKTTNYEPGVMPKTGAMVEQFNFSSAHGLHEETERKFVDKYGDLPSVAFSAKANKALLAMHFIAAMQAVSEGATTPFVKTITSGFLGNGLDFASGEGFLFSVGVENFDDGLYNQGGILKNALLNDFSFEIQPNNKGIARLSDIKGTWIGSEWVPLEDERFTGTWVAQPSKDLTYGDKFELSVSVGTLSTASDILYRRFALNINNNITSDLKVAGVPANFKASPKWTAEIDIPYYTPDDGGSLATSKYVKAFQDGLNVSVTFDTGTTGADGCLTFAIPHGCITAEPLQVNGEYFAIRLTLDLLSASGATPLTVVLADSIDGGY